MRFVDYPFKVTYNVFVEVSEKNVIRGCIYLVAARLFLIFKNAMRRRMWFWWEIYQTLKKRKRAHIVFSIIRQFFLYCLQQKRILWHYLLMALNIWCMLPLNKNEIKLKHIIKLYYMSYLCVIFNASKQLL